MHLFNVEVLYIIIFTTYYHTLSDENSGTNSYMKSRLSCRGKDWYPSNSSKNYILEVCLLFVTRSTLCVRIKSGAGLYRKIANIHEDDIDNLKTHDT